MDKTRKRRRDAVRYDFYFFDCPDCLIKQGKKTYVYEAVIVRLAKKLVNYAQPVYSLYRDLHRCGSFKYIYGMRAICLEDFNAENMCCTVHVSAEPGKDVLMLEDDKL